MSFVISMVQVSIRDVGEQFFRTFAGQQADQNIERLLKDEITMQEWLKELCDVMPPIDRNEFLGFIDQFEVDPHFADFDRFCQEQEIPVVILSDGLDAYVERVGKCRIERICTSSQTMRSFKTCMAGENSQCLFPTRMPMSSVRQLQTQSYAERFGR